MFNTNFSAILFDTTTTIEVAKKFEDSLKANFISHRLYQNGHDPHNLQLLETGNSELFTADPVEWFAGKGFPLAWHKRLAESGHHEKYSKIQPKPVPSRKPVKVAPKELSDSPRWMDDPSRNMPSGGLAGECHNLGKTTWHKSAGRSYGSGRAL
jgi:hypothetical protein